MQFCVKRDGLLYFTEDGADSTAKQWIVDKESQMKVITSCHDQKLGGGHFGRDKTLQKICSRFYWHVITKHIKEHVDTCEQCQKANPKMIKETAVLHPIPVKTEVWYQIGIDLVGPRTFTRRGSRYLATCIDYFSKWRVAQALPTKSAEEVAHFLLSLIARLGCFHVCISDQGREFVNSFNEKLFEIAGVEHWVSSAYHPQTNGLDERMNQTLTKAIVKYINTEQDDWDEHIESMLFSYRTSVHASTKFTPFYLMYGREAVLPVQLQLIDRNQDGSVVDELHVENDTVQLYATQLEKIKKELFPKVDVNIKKAQKKQKEFYDERCTPEKNQIGDLVLVKNMRNLSRAEGKTDERWTGPYAIVNIHEKRLYRLRKLSDGKQLANNINESRLKPFHERV
ncbi:hypothetical protein EMCRGX_G016393 [Ephydatia muelleri]